MITIDIRKQPYFNKVVEYFFDHIYFSDKHHFSTLYEWLRFDYNASTNFNNDLIFENDYDAVRFLLKWE